MLFAGRRRYAGLQIVPNLLVLHVAGALFAFFRPLASLLRRFLPFANRSRRRRHVRTQIVPDLFVFDVPAGMTRDGLGGAREGKTADNEGGAGCHESMRMVVKSP